MGGKGSRFVWIRLSRNLFFLVATCTLFSDSRAGIVLEPTTGHVLFDGTSNDDGVVKILDQGSYIGGPAFDGSFYGGSVTQNMWVAENGYLSISDAQDPGGFYSYAFTSNSNLRQIAPFGDDFFLVAGEPNRIVDHSLAGSYLAVTWEDVWLFNDGTVDPNMSRTAQVIWFERDMDVRGFSFKKNDIAFGYSGFSDGWFETTIGVGRNSNSFTSIPNDADGLIFSEDSHPGNGQNNLIPWGDNEFLLFRPSTLPNGDPSYSASVETFTAVPEPSSIGVAIAWLCLVVAKWRRKIFSVVVGQRAS